MENVLQWKMEKQTANLLTNDKNETWYLEIFLYFVIFLDIQDMEP